MGFPKVRGPFLERFVDKCHSVLFGRRLGTGVPSFIETTKSKAPTLPYLEGQEDLASRLILGITGVTIWLIGVINLLTKSL